MTMKVVSFGELLLRLAAPGYAKLFQKDMLDVTFCGAEANVAVSLAVLGLDSVFLTKLPKGVVGQAGINSLHYFGVDTSKIVFDGGRMGIYFLEKGVSQRPSKVIYDRANSVFALAQRTDFNWDIVLNDVDWFHWTGINPALSDNMAAICEDAVKTAKQKGIMVSCDLNYRSTLWDSAKARTVMSKLMHYVDVCIANEEDAEKVLNIKLENNNIQTGKLNKLGYKDVAQKISKEYKCKYVAVTLRESYSASVNGWSGMLYCSKENKAYFSRKYDIQLVDRVGGGDSFGAGLIYALITGKTSQEAIEFAVAASCLKHTIEGDYNRTTLEEIEELINNGGGGRIHR